MVQLRYANYPKDYFMGMLPSSQYGSVAVLPALNSSHESNSVAFGSDSRLMQYATLTNPNGGTSTSVSPTNSTGSAKYAFLNSDLSALYRDWETDRKSTRLNSSHITRSRMPSSA